ncbi:DUF397 domain-containing protein [Nocardia sp. NPDC004168]|uniref:DUF397 domain-containing protein n=1 Tax=Nocardia sp. NPDC004168 TaxID=3154452 RepID=UPI0033B233D9
MNIDPSRAKWFKSTRSSMGKDCVEVAFLAQGMVGVRDSKNPTSPALVFAPGDWDAFTSAVRVDEFTRPA